MLIALHDYNGYTNTLIFCYITLRVLLLIAVTSILFREYSYIDTHDKSKITSIQWREDLVF
jgi:hypothetical protein